MAERTFKPASSRRWWGLIAMGVVLVVVFAVFVAITSGSTEPQSQRLAIGTTAPDASFTTVNGTSASIKTLRGQPAVVYFVTTFCDSCQAGTQAMARHIDEFAQHHVKVVELQLADNLGGDGPDIATFGRELAGKNYTHPAWVWGTASPAMSSTYDPRSFLDLYYLIDAQGKIVYVNDNPDSTMNALLDQVKRRSSKNDAVASKSGLGKIGMVWTPTDSI